MLIKGEKYACDACVRGHRVSSCTHTDRPLIHINRKGRPVSQCPHCRGLRKARAQHVKCDCAEKAHTKEECPHDKSEAKKVEHKPCCCGHGVRCTCALKKEPSLDPVPEDKPSSPVGRRTARDGNRPPRLSNTYSMESKTTVFFNGHHKPVHKMNDIHNRVGAPYRIPGRSHTISSHREFVPRSTDSLPLTKELLNGHINPPFHASVTSAPHSSRRVKSEHGSPTMGALPMPRDNHVPPISIPPYDPNVYSYSPFSAGSPASVGSNPWEGTFPEQFPDNFFVSYEMANEMRSPTPSVGMGADPPDIDWSTYNLPNGLGNSPADYRLSNGALIPSQPPSYASFDHFSHFSHPGLTSSSGDISEVEDYVPIAEATSLRDSSHDALNDFSSVGGDELTEPETFRLSSASSYIGMPEARMLASENVDSLDIDEYVKNAEAHTRELALQNQRMQQDQQQLAQRQILGPTPDIYNQTPDYDQFSFSIQQTSKPSHPSYPEGLSGLSVQPDITGSFHQDSTVGTISRGLNRVTETDERDDGWVR